jgi:hypothetical protein
LEEDDINIDGQKMSHWLGAYRKMEWTRKIKRFLFKIRVLRQKNHRF